jgi:riboflavin biosynthesis pyrimidine reductase
MRQLYPVARDDVDPATVYGEMPATGDRPWVRLNMIASVDGATAVEGLSGGLGGPADHRVFAVLRSLADVILVAAGTMRAEGYGPVRLPPPVVEARVARAQAGVPAIAVVTRTCRLDWQSPFFAEATARPVVITSAAADPADRQRAEEVADVVLAGADTVDLRLAMRLLTERGARSILAEGGPTLNGALAAAGLLDEVCVSVSPVLVGADAKRILAMADLPAPTRVSIQSVCEEDGYLFLRYRVDRSE